MGYWLMFLFGGAVMMFLQHIQSEADEPFDFLAVVAIVLCYVGTLLYLVANGIYYTAVR